MTKPYSIAIFGGTGFIGSELTQFLAHLGHSVTIFSRTPKHSDHLYWNPSKLDGWETTLSKFDVVINLVGISIAQSRWTPSQKKKLIDSRVVPTKTLVDAIARSSPAPALLINAAAIGIYPTFETLPPQGSTENSAFGEGFLSQLCRSWESIATTAPITTRVVLLRMGVVLGHGGFLKKLTPIFSKGLGAIFGNGQAPFGWIHIQDLCSIIQLVLTNHSLSGPINCVSPEITTHRTFFKTFAHVLQRPLLFYIPSWATRLIFGDISEILLKGPLVLTTKLNQTQFKFKFVKLEDALMQILR